MLNIHSTQTEALVCIQVKMSSEYISPGLQSLMADDVVNSGTYNPPFPTHFVLTQNATGWKIVSIDYFSFSPHFVRIHLFNFSKDFTRTERVTPNILSP